MRIPNRLMPHGGLVRYRVKRGTTGDGTGGFGPWVTPKRAAIQDAMKLASGSASERVTTGIVWLDPEHVVGVGAEITVWYGTARARTTVVDQAKYHEAGPGLPEHTELRLI